MAARELNDAEKEIMQYICMSYKKDCHCDAGCKLAVYMPKILELLAHARYLSQEDIRKHELEQLHDIANKWWNMCILDPAYENQLKFEKELADFLQSESRKAYEQGKHDYAHKKYEQSIPTVKRFIDKHRSLGLCIACNERVGPKSTVMCNLHFLEKKARDKKYGRRGRNAPMKHRINLPKPSITGEEQK